jgi:membrane complex biogenesis BtpA family protein
MFKDLREKKYVIGLVHLRPLPGTPLFHEDDFDLSMEKAIRDTQALLDGGADGCLLQTVDKIYPATDDTDYARVSAMAVIAHEVRKLVGSRNFKIGVQMMWNCITPSLAVAKVCKADFTRCSALIGTTPSPFGTIEANPLKVQNYRKFIGASNVAVIAEIQGYHFKGEYDSETIKIHAGSAKTVGADAVEVMHKDEELNNRIVHDIKSAKDSLPVILGGGTDLDNVTRRIREADGVLVGSCFENGKWGGNIDPNTVREYVNLVRSIRR